MKKYGYLEKDIKDRSWLIQRNTNNILKMSKDPLEDKNRNSLKYGYNWI